MKNTRVPNGRRKTGLDQLVQSTLKSSLMLEIRLTRQSRLLKPTRPGLVRPGPPSNGICYFYHYIFLSHEAFLKKNYCFHRLYGGDSASLWLEVVQIDSQVSNYFSYVKWVILHDQLPQYGYSMPLIHRVIAFPPHAILSMMFYKPELRGCWFIPWQAALKSFYS